MATGNTARSIGRNSTRCSPATAPATATGWRRGARRMNDGAWVREAALAYAEKRKQRQTAQSGGIGNHHATRTRALEVFIRSRTGLRTNMSLLHAADTTLALQAPATSTPAARGALDRVVPSNSITASDPSEKA